MTIEEGRDAVWYILVLVLVAGGVITGYIFWKLWKDRGKW